ncbi:MAG TPA: Rieske 2Fe-2S domain-containing protein [Acidimicrobiales bacterium]|nr:Rieske 2Fe-2S domain-containing protein [Acidimicrobiales bacterium]
MRPAVRSDDCRIGEPGEPDFHVVRVGRADVLVARLPDGRPVAFSAECPHQATPLEGATFWEGQLRCARHLYLYDVHTGENVLPTRDASSESLVRLKPGYLPVYRTEERDGWIWVADAPEPPPPGWDQAAHRVVATPPPPPEPEPVPAGPQTVHLRVGEQHEVVLATTPRPAHLWRSAVSGGGVAIVSEGFAPDQPPRHVARLAARAPGQAEVTFSYGTPWSPEPVESRTFVVVVRD